MSRNGDVMNLEDIFAYFKNEFIESVYTAPNLFHPDKNFTYKIETNTIYRF